MTVPGAWRLYEFLTLTGISPSLAGRIDWGCKTYQKTSTRSYNKNKFIGSYKISAKITDLLNQKQKGKTKANENDHVN
jgi:hypothetical protein